MAVAKPARRGRTKVATLHAVAKAAGVSTATVSKALNGLPVSPENLARVQEAAEALGYVPNQAARSIRGAPTMTIGFVMAFDLHPATELMAIVSSLIADMQDNGYSVFLSMPGEASDPDPLLWRFIERRIDGLFLWNARASSALAAYESAGIPIVAIGPRAPGLEALPMVTVDSTAVYRQLYRDLRSLGHRAAIEIAPGPVADVHRASARAAGIDWEAVTIGFDAESATDFVRSLDRPGGPTVVLGAYPSVVQVLAATVELGMEVPRDLSIVAITESPGAALLRTPLSAVRTDWERIGEASAQAMLRALAGERLADEVLPGCVEWIPRASVGPAPKRPRSRGLRT